MDNVGNLANNINSVIRSWITIEAQHNFAMLSTVNRTFSIKKI